MAIETLMENSSGLIRRLAPMLGGDLGAAEDLHQEALLRAWRRMPAELGPAAQRAWLARTARNLAIDELRRRSRVTMLPLEGLGESGPAFEYDGGEEAREALGMLSRHERFVLLLRFDVGLAHAEIASLLDISEDATRKRVARARRAFLAAYRRVRAGQRPLILLLSRGEDTSPYVSWLERAGGEVRITSGPSERDLTLADGLVFSGAFDDLDPSLYGERPRPVLRGRPNPELDRADHQVVSRAISLALPLVGVCRGHQLLNVASGGSLYQDVVSDGATRETHTAGVHAVRTEGGTKTRALLGRSTEVLSEHHQAVRRLGRNLRVAARSPDGIVETIERTDRRFALGLQWHPEHGTEGAAGDRVAEALLAAAQERAA